MTSLSVFVFQGHDVRFVGTPDKPEWVAKDVCDVLGISNSREALARLEDYQKGVITTDTLGGIQKLATVTEPGLYALIFTSRKETAKDFQRWVFSEVLPSIRKTGGYGKTEYNPQWFKRLVLFRSKTKIPTGWFCIFEEMSMALMADFEDAGYSLPDKAIPDISIGKCFCNYLRSLGYDTTKGAGYVRSYVHRYPDGRTPEANIYANEILPLYREWFAETYKPHNLPAYLKRQNPNVPPSLCAALGLPEGSV